MAGPHHSASVLICCGEASGDVYAAQVARELRALRPGLRLLGVGGPLLAAEVDELWYGLDDLRVMGFAEVLRHLPRLRRLRNELVSRARSADVSLLLAVDYPGFNVSLAGAMKRVGIPTLHYIPPKTWSWGAWRNGSLRRSVRGCAVIFPFEQDYYRDRDIPARFVGHPLFERYRHPVDPWSDRREGLLLVPGSRRQELLRIGPVMAEAASVLLADGRLESVRISRAPGVEEAWLSPMREALPGAEVVEGTLAEQLAGSEVAAVTSGTATVEAALSKTPHVIGYRTSALTYGVAKLLATVDYIGMANIVLGRRAFPELVQSQLKAKALAEQLGRLHRADSPERREQAEAFDELRARLDSGEVAAVAVARMALSLLDGGDP